MQVQTVSEGQGEVTCQLSLKSQWLQHPPSTLMPSPPHPTLTATNVVIPIPLPSAQHMDSNAMHVAAPITLQHCVSREDGDSPVDRLHAKVTALPGEATASITDAAQATLPTGTTVRAQAIVLPIVLPEAQAIAHCLINLTDTIPTNHPIGTPRIVSRSSPLITLRQAPSLKVPLYRKYLWWAGSLLHKAPTTNPWWDQADDHKDRSWCSGKQVPFPLP